MESYLNRLVIERMGPSVLKTASDIYPAWIDQYELAKRIYDPEITQYSVAVAYSRAILEHLARLGRLEERVENGGQVVYRFKREGYR